MYEEAFGRPSEGALVDMVVLSGIAGKGGRYLISVNNGTARLSTLQHEILVSI
jgi:hypothetical protein